MFLFNLFNYACLRWLLWSALVMMVFNQQQDFDRCRTTLLLSPPCADRLHLASIFTAVLACHSSSLSHLNSLENNYLSGLFDFFNERQTLHLKFRRPSTVFAPVFG